MTATTPNIAQARRFLDAIGSPPWCFQTFDDAGEDKALAGTRSGSLDANFAWLSERHARGAGVFVTVNVVDGQRRLASNVTRIRALFADIDQEAIPDVPLEPTIRVRTGRGWHLYWRCDDVPLERFSEMQRRVIAALDADPACHDLPRVMRLPGFAWLKDREAPRRVVVVDDAGPAYAFAEIEAAFAPLAEPESPAPTPLAPRKPSADVAYARRLERAEAYVQAMPGGHNGAGGSDACFRAALACVKGFALDVGDAVSVLKRVHNPKCSAEKGRRAAWTDDELRHKCESAQAAQRVDVGYLLDADDADAPVMPERLTKPNPNAGTGAGGKPPGADGKRRKRPPKPKPPELAESFRSAVPTMYVYETLYCYERGVYLPNGEQRARAWVQEQLADRSTRRDGTEAVYWLEQATATDPIDVDRAGRVNVANGLLNWRTGALDEHTPRHRYTVQLPVVWDPEAHDPRGDSFLDEVLPDAETRRVVEEFFGYCLLPDCRYQKALMCTAEEGRNGKSVLLEWLGAMLGERNVSHASLQSLDERFQAAALVGSLANIYADLPRAALADTGTFKMLVAGDTLRVERKHQDPFDYRNRAKLIFSANELPGTRDRSSAFFRRWIIVPFPNRFDDGRADPNLGAKLAQPQARAYLLRLAVEGLRRLDARGHFEDTPATREALESYRRGADDVVRFVDERCVIDSAGVFVCRDMYRAYSEWCEEEGQRAVAANTFGRRIGAYAGIGKAQITHDLKRAWAYTGVRSRGPSDD